MNSKIKTLEEQIKESKKALEERTDVKFDVGKKDGHKKFEELVALKRSR